VAVITKKLMIVLTVLKMMSIWIVVMNLMQVVISKLWQLFKDKKVIKAVFRKK